MHEAIDTGKEFGQLASPLLQTHSAVFGRVELLTDLGAQRGPAGFGDQVGFGIGIAPAAGHPDIARAQGPAQLPQGTELIVVAVNAAVRGHHVRPPLQGDKVGRRLRGHGAAMGRVELLQQRHRLQQRFRLLRGSGR